MFTQCPKCQTIFEITAEHLKAAGGDVRCGHCLNVFNALENLSEEIPEHAVANNNDTTETEPLFETAETNQTLSQSAQETDAVINSATINDAIIDTTTDIEAVETQSENTEEDHEFSQFFGDVLPEEDDAGLDYETRIKQKAATNPEDQFFYGGANESVINKILEEKVTEDSLTYESEEEGAESKNGKVKESRSGEKKTEASKESKAEEDKNATLEIPPLLVEDLQEDQEQRSGQSKLWLVGSLVLMLIFILQGIYFSRDDLAKNPTYRPWLTKACQTLGCTIAVPYDIGQIEIIGRDVRTHPKAARALIAGTTLINNAKFNQPYPLLTLTFSDMTGTVLAQRRFTPREYLKPGTNIKAGMTPDVPVQVELELIDPGKNAVNFEFRAEADPRSIHPHT